MRIFFAFVFHETNGFSPVPTSLLSFKDDYWRPKDDPQGKQVEKIFLLGDLVRVARERGHDPAFGIMTSAVPSGPMTRETFDVLRDAVLEDLKAAGHPDAVFLVLHGAAFADGHDDCEGEILAAVRELVGADTPIGALLDLHGNIGQKMIDSANVLAGCLEYPHTDLLERGKEVMTLLERAHRGEIRPKMIRRHLPMLGVFHTTREPMRSFVDDVKTMQQGDILSISLMHGFPWADLPITGATVMICCNEGGEGPATELAEHLAERFFSYRDQGTEPCLSVEQAVTKALSAPRGPVVLADVADNPGGGAPGDATFILRESLARGAADAAFAMFYDIVALRLCQITGEGGSLKLRLGGKFGPVSGDPVDIECRVMRLRDLPGHGMSAAMVQTGGIRIIISDRRGQVFTPDTFTEMGVDPAKQKILVVKSGHHFRAGFDAIAAETIYCETPGCLSYDFARFPFRRIVRPIHPLDTLERLPMAVGLGQQGEYGV